MFCSNCGKTLAAGQPNCPHCGAVVGESLLSGHTSVQRWVKPASDTDLKAPPRYTPYTKTSYTSMDERGDDVYSRTAYRPVLTKPAAETTGAPKPIEPEHEEDADEDVNNDLHASINTDDPALKLKKMPDEGDEQQKESLSKLRAVPQDAPALGEAQKILKRELDIKLEPIKPIKKTGISPAVESYMKRMEEQKERSRKKPHRDDAADEPVSASGDIEPEEIAIEGDEPAPVRKAASKVKRAPASDRHVGRWIARIVAGLAICALLVGGVVYLAYRTQPQAVINGVTDDLYTQGLALIKSHTTNEYRTGIIKLFKDDQTGAAAVNQQAADLGAIQALLPEKPQENDQKLIDTLTMIQTSINTATTTDALAALTSGDSSLTSLSSTSQDQWDAINNSITRLENITDVDSDKRLQQLKAIIDDSAAVSATPAPTATPEPSAYKTLSSRMKNNKAVKRLQQRLYQLGWFNGTRDGDFGTVTATAVKQYQQAAGMEVTGIATPEFQEAVFADDALRTGSKVTPAPDIDAAVGGADESDADVIDGNDVGQINTAQ